MPKKKVQKKAAPAKQAKPSKLATAFGFVQAHKIATSVTATLLLLIGGSIAWLSKPAEPEYILATVERGNIQQTVEAVGEVVSEKDLKLKFPVTGVVADVLVTEGETITAGQELARLRNDALQADVSFASARLAAENARLTELKEGSRPEDIRIAEAELANKQAALEAAETTYEGALQKLASAQTKLDLLLQEAAVSLGGYTSTSQSTSSKEITATQSALRRVEDLLLTSNIQPILQSFSSSQYSIIRRRLDTAEVTLNTLDGTTTGSDGDYRAVLEDLEDIRTAISLAADAIDGAYTLISDLPPAGNSFDRSTRETLKTNFSTQAQNARSSLSSIDASIKDLRDAAASFDTKIAAEQNAVASAQSTMDSSQADILTFETAMRTSRAQLDRERAGARLTEVQAAQAAVNQAYAERSRAVARLEDTILRAPIDGVITKVDMKAGEFTGDFENFNNVISMLGASPYRIEMYVAEIDIPRVQLTQTGSIELDAFPREDILLRVSEIDPIATAVDGVPKYLVTLDFLSPPKGMRIGMSGDATIFTAERSDVLHIPGRAVYRKDTGEYVRILLNEEIIEREIVTGLDGSGGELEVISGLEEGETVIVLIRE